MSTPHDPSDATNRPGEIEGPTAGSDADTGSPGDGQASPGPSLTRRPRSRSSGPSDGRDIGRLVRRYGPFVLVAAMGAGAFVVFGGGGGGGDDDEAEVPADASSEREQLILSGPLTPERAELEGADPDFGPNCDPNTGRIKLPTVYAPPCVVPFEGDNGGATSMGVTEGTIKLVAYVTDPQVDPLFSATVGAADQDLDLGRQEETIQGFVDLFNEMFETYGREVDAEIFKGTGALDDDVAARADAIAIAEKEPFAVIGGPLQASPTFSDELAARGVLCLADGCATGLSGDFLEERAPFLWTGGAPEVGIELIAEMMTKLAGPGKAEMAGAPALREQDRVYGSVRFNDPDGFLEGDFTRVRDRMSEDGIEFEVDVPYFLDFARVQENARTIISRLKAAGVTTVLFQGDPVTPGSLTEEATAQDYFPEWILGANFAADSPRFARGYDPEQWTNGFGLTFVTSPGPPGSAPLFEWAFGAEAPSGNFANTLEPPLRMLFNGIHLAGPELTPETFGDGLLRYPASGGGPTVPLYQPHNSTGGDMAIIQWDPDAEGVDPDGTENVGFYQFTNGGQRYQPGEIPSSPEEAGLFDEESSVVQYDDVPPEDRAPDYTPPEL